MIWCWGCCMMSLLACVFRLNDSLSQCVYSHNSLLKWRSQAVSALNMKILFSETTTWKSPRINFIFALLNFIEMGWCLKNTCLSIDVKMSCLQISLFQWVLSFPIHFNFTFKIKFDCSFVTSEFWLLVRKCSPFLTKHMESCIVSQIFQPFLK